MGLFTGLRQKMFQPETGTQLFSFDRPRRIPAMPEKPDTIVVYEIIAGLVMAQVQKDCYRVAEPEFTDVERETYTLVQKGLFEILSIDAAEDPIPYIEKCTKVLLSELDLRVSEDFLQKMVYFIYRDILGYGKLEALLRDTLVSEIRYDKALSIVHARYGTLKTDITFTAEELMRILRKFALRCDMDITMVVEPTVECKTEDMVVSLHYIREQPALSTFAVKKTVAEGSLVSPVELINQRRISPEILAYLWMLVEAKKNIYVVNDPQILHALRFFVPPHAKVLTNMPGYRPNPFTETIIGSYYGEEDYALIHKYTNQEVRGALLATIDFVSESGNVVVYTESGVVTRIREDTKDLFVYQKGKFLFNLEGSSYMQAKGKAISAAEFQLRTRLILLMVRNKLSDSDFQKTIAIYYDNPGAVLKRVGFA